VPAGGSVASNTPEPQLTGCCRRRCCFPPLPPLLLLSDAADGLPPPPLLAAAAADRLHFSDWTITTTDNCVYADMAERYYRYKWWCAAAGEAL
jgi:hypothetical protein